MVWIWTIMDILILYNRIFLTSLTPKHPNKDTWPLKNWINNVYHRLEKVTILILNFCQILLNWTNLFLMKGFSFFPIILSLNDIFYCSGSSSPSGDLLPKLVVPIEKNKTWGLIMTIGLNILINEKTFNLEVQVC